MGLLIHISLKFGWVDLQMLKNFALFFLLISTVDSFAQQDSMQYDKNYFRSPLAIPIQLTANFGELRSNHWHMGLDIRTQQKENLPVYASAEGYIAKILVHPFSYGRAIYINHPNGLTTLYGHLNEFYPELEKYVVEQQYKNESWATVINITPGIFTISRGQVIAKSGNSGGSMGPHLHFEIRNTKTNHYLNPLLFNFSVSDNIPPVIKRLAIYDRERSVFEQSPQIFSVKKTKEGYIANPSMIVTNHKKISFAIGAYDKDNSSSSQQGIYSAKLFFDEKLSSSFKLDSIGNEETAYINAQIDHKYFIERGGYLQHLSPLPANRSSIYQKINSNGVIELNDTVPHVVRVEVKDINNNLSELCFGIQYSYAIRIEKETTSQQKFHPQMINVLERKDFEAYLTEDCLYDGFESIYYRNENFQKDAVSAIHKLNDANIPVQDSFLVRIKPTQKIPELQKNNVLIKRTYNGKSTVKKASWQGKWLSAYFGDFGSYQAFMDTTAPVLNSLGNKDTIDLSRANYIVFSPTDDFGIIKNFRAELDGKWLMFTNDKGKKFIYTFDDKCSYGIHELKVTVEDLVGNTTTKSWWFKRNPYTAPVKKIVKRKK